MGMTIDQARHQGLTPQAEHLGALRFERNVGDCPDSRALDQHIALGPGPVDEAGMAQQNRRTRRRAGHGFPTR